MVIFVNGKELEFADAITLGALIESLSLDGKVMAAAVNMEIVKQDRWSGHRLNDGDKIELLDFVGGG